MLQCLVKPHRPKAGPAEPAQSRSGGRWWFPLKEEEEEARGDATATSSSHYVRITLSIFSDKPSLSFLLLAASRQ